VTDVLPVSLVLRVTFDHGPGRSLAGRVGERHPGGRPSRAVTPKAARSRLVARAGGGGVGDRGLSRGERVLAGGASLDVAERVAVRCEEVQVGRAGGLRWRHACELMMSSQLASTTASASISARLSEAVLIAAASPSLRP